MECEARSVLMMDPERRGRYYRLVEDARGLAALRALQTEVGNQGAAASRVRGGSGSATQPGLF